MKGPSVKLELSCFDCEHCKTSSYACQGDSGSDVHCEAVKDDRGAMRRVGDTSWRTPDWCPYRTQAIQSQICLQQSSLPVQSVKTPATCNSCGQTFDAPTTGTMGDRCPACGTGRLIFDANVKVI